MRVTVKCGRLSGKVTAPPSKSYAHRYLIASALSDNKILPKGIIDSDDICATKKCIDALLSENADNRTFFCGESGSTLRFFIPLACVIGNGGHFVCSKRLSDRGIDVYKTALKNCGIEIENETDGFFVRGTLKNGEYFVPGNISSQYITGLLFALPLLSGDSIITVTGTVESRQYIDITLEVLKMYGIDIFETSPNVFSIKGNQQYRSFECSVPGDWSNAAFFIAVKMTENGENVIVDGLNDDTRQGDSICVDYFESLKEGFCELDISDCPDLGPVLFAFAAMNHGGKFTGTKRLKIKESDRAEAMSEELAKFQIKTEIADNSVTVFEGTLCKPNGVLYGHSDHRIVMALSVLLTSTGGTIDGAESVCKSYPDFFADLESLGALIEYENCENNQG